MNAARWTLALAVCLILAERGVAQAPSPARVDELIAKLGSASYLQREQAHKQLAASGPAALEPARKHRASADPETARRLDSLIALFEEQILTREILAPKEIHVKLKGATVHEAIAELAKVSGHPIQFQGDATHFADKIITLDLGKTSFWQALDRVCDEARLMVRVDPIEQQPQVEFLGGRRRMQRIQPPAPQPMRPIVITNRTWAKSFVSYAGAVKTELRVSRWSAGKEFEVTMRVFAEPGMQNADILGRPILQKIVDDKGRQLADLVNAPKLNDSALAADRLIIDAVNMGRTPPTHLHDIKIRIADRPIAAKSLKELAGNLTMQVDRQNEVLAKIGNVLDSAGKSVPAKNGGTLKVNSIEKKNGRIEMQLALENTPGNPFGGNVVFNGGNIVIRGNNVRIQGMVIGPGGGVQITGGGGSQQDVPALLDAKGQKFQLGGILAESTSIINGSYSRTLRVAYQPGPNQAEPRELVLFGTRTHTIAVPFRFENVPLP